MLALFGYYAIMLDARQIADIVRVEDRDGEVSSSTLHYYVQVGILPPAVGRGRSGYTPEHLARFRLARRMKRQGAALARVRERLNGMTPTEVAAQLGAAWEPAAGPGPADGQALYSASSPAPLTLRDAAGARQDDAATRYTIAAAALRARGGGTPRTLRFRGGFSLQVPAGASDERVARLYTAIEAALSDEAAGAPGPDQPVSGGPAPDEEEAR